jgi:hypothetical protein
MHCRLFALGVQGLECNAAILKSHFSDPFNWYLQYFHIAHTGALVINDLAHLPACPLVDRAWAAIDFLVSNPDPYRTGSPNWSRYIRAFQKLFERAYINRERTGAGGLQSQNRGLESNLRDLRQLFYSDPNTSSSAPQSASSPSSPSVVSGLGPDDNALPLPFMDHPYDPTESMSQSYQNYSWVSFTATIKPEYPMDFLGDLMS